MLETYSLRGKDRLLLIVAATMMCLPPVLVDHQAGLHEATHAQCLREMMESGNWLVPTVGGMPWRESLPLTQWLASTASSAFGVSNVLAAIRFAGLLPLVLATLWTASFAASCSGRRSGILAGFILLTTLGIAENVWHGGIVIWLAAAGSGIMKLLAGLESRIQKKLLDTDWTGSSVGNRTLNSTRVIFVFILLGLTTTIAGPIPALVTVLIPSAGHILLRRDLSLKWNNPWIVGWLITAAITVAWPIAISSLVENSSTEWFRSSPSLGASQYSLDQFRQLAQMSLPWLPLAIFGQWSLRHDAFAGSSSRERLLAWWSLSVPPAAFLLTPSRMDFAIAAAGAWSVSAAIGVERLSVRIFKELPMLETRHNRTIFQKFLAGCAAVLTLSTVWSDPGSGSRQIDRQMLSEARIIIEQGQSLCVDMNSGDQAAAILWELGDLVTPMNHQRHPDLRENTVVISTKSLQQRALEQGLASQISEGRAQQDLIMVRMNAPESHQATRFAADRTLNWY